MKSNFIKIPFLFSIIFCVFFGFIFFFFYRAININNVKSQLAENEWQTEELKREEIKTLDRSVKTIEGERAQLETHFAKSSDVVPFLGTIGRLALEANTKEEITSVYISGDNTQLIVGINVSGTFSKLYKFLTLLENSPYELEFSRVGLHKETAQDMSSKIISAPNWNMLIDIKLLSFISQNKK